MTPIKNYVLIHDGDPYDERHICWFVAHNPDGSWSYGQDMGGWLVPMSNRGGLATAGECLDIIAGEIASRDDSDVVVVLAAMLEGLRLPS